MARPAPANTSPIRRASGNLQDGISRGGTVTGDPADSPPKDGYGLTEKVDEVDDKTRKSDGTNV